MTDRKEKFTPGKWEVADASNGELWICANRSDVIASVYGNSGNVGNANAHLIAAAPEMYEALSDVQDVLRGICQSCDTPDSIRIKLEPLIYRGEAIQKKARGEE